MHHLLNNTSVLKEILVTSLFMQLTHIYYLTALQLKTNKPKLKAKKIKKVTLEDLKVFALRPCSAHTLESKIICNAKKLTTTKAIYLPPLSTSKKW